MCVRQFDDSLNSAIHNTLSRFATVFIDARAKGSTVGSCLATSHTNNNSYGIQDKVKRKVRIPEGTRRTPGCRPHDGGRQQGALPALGVLSRSRRPPERPSATGTGRNGSRPPRRSDGYGNDPSAGSPTETLLRLLLHRPASNKGSFP